MTAAYSIYSAPAHAEWHAILSRYKEEMLPDGNRRMITRPDRVAVAAAAVAAVGFAVRPTDRALTLLGRSARLAEIPCHALHAQELLRGGLAALNLWVARHRSTSPGLVGAW